MHIVRNGVLVIAAAVGLGAGLAQAKLPAPTPQEQEAAAQKKAQAAAAAEVEKAALAKVQDQIAARYIAEQKAKGIMVTPTPLAAGATSKEIPAAALDHRPVEKAGAYNQSETTQSAQTSAASGSAANGAPPTDRKK